MEPVESARALQILLVEDNPADVRMTREALAFARIAHDLHVVGDGDQALAFLLREGAFAGAPIPDLMLLDLSLPGLSGHGVLQALRDRRAKRSFPVVVLTGSKLQSDLERSFALNADTQIVKPAGLAQYAAELRFAVGLAHPGYG
jgi:CheY-like chemotaxis protein